MVLAMLEWMETNVIYNHTMGRSVVDQRGEYLCELLAEHSWASNVRGPGLMVAFDTDVDIRALTKAALNQRLLLGLFKPGVVKLTPPLNIGEEQLAEGVARLDRAFRILSDGSVES
jgi:acetylornithine/succinyldiaminopimelate/putrescine aminotransferase